MITSEGKLEIQFQKKDYKDAEIFFSLYRLLGADFATEKFIEETKSIELKSCRYCGKNSNQTTFNNVAHTIPEFMGNKGSISDFECDNCNKQFGNLENQLANFLGPQRTLQNIRGKKKVPTIFSCDNKTVAKPSKLFSKYDVIEFGNNNSDSTNTSFNKKEGCHEVIFKTQKYIPYAIYKCLLKFALGLIPKEKCDTYQLAFDILKDYRHRNFKDNSHHFLVVNNLKTEYDYCGIFLFESIQTNDIQIPPLSLVLFSGHYMYQIFIPYSKEYFPKAENEIILCPFLPAFLPSKEIKKIDYNREIMDLNSLSMVSRTLLYEIKADIINRDIVALDSNTGIQKEINFNPHNIIKIAFINKSTTIEFNK